MSTLRTTDHSASLLFAALSDSLLSLIELLSANARAAIITTLDDGALLANAKNTIDPALEVQAESEI
jgi:hypothetical protein